MKIRKIEWYAGENTHTITLSGLRFEDSEDDLTDATVSVTVLKEDGTEVPGPDWPLDIPWDAANSFYKVIITDAEASSAGETIRVIVKATKGDGKGEWESTVPVKARELTH